MGEKSGAVIPGSNEFRTKYKSNVGGAHPVDFGTEGDAAEEMNDILKKRAVGQW